MVETSQSNACGIPGCHDPASPATAGVCERHFAQASLRSRERYAVVARRLAAVQEWWDDEARYDAVVESDRWLKLSHATACATDAVDAARERLMLSIFAAQSQSQAAPANPAASAQQGRSIA